MKEDNLDIQFDKIDKLRTRAVPRLQDICCIKIAILLWRRTNPPIWYWLCKGEYTDDLREKPTVAECAKCIMSKIYSLHLPKSLKSKLFYFGCRIMKELDSFYRYHWNSAKFRKDKIAVLHIDDIVWNISGGFIDYYESMVFLTNEFKLGTKQEFDLVCMYAIEEKIMQFESRPEIVELAKSSYAGNALDVCWAHGVLNPSDPPFAYAMHETPCVYKNIHSLRNKRLRDFWYGGDSMTHVVSNDQKLETAMAWLEDESPSNINCMWTLLDDETFLSMIDERCWIDCLLKRYLKHYFFEEFTRIADFLIRNENNRLRLIHLIEKSMSKGVLNEHFTLIEYIFEEFPMEMDYKTSLILLRNLKWELHSRFVELIISRTKGSFEGDEYTAKPSFGMHDVKWYFVRDLMLNFISRHELVIAEMLIQLCFPDGHAEREHIYQCLNAFYYTMSEEALCSQTSSSLTLNGWISKQRIRFFTRNPDENQLPIPFPIILERKELKYIRPPKKFLRIFLGRLNQYPQKPDKSYNYPKVYITEPRNRTLTRTFSDVFEFIRFVFGIGNTIPEIEVGQRFGSEIPILRETVEYLKTRKSRKNTRTKKDLINTVV